MSKFVQPLPESAKSPPLPTAFEYLKQAAEHKRALNAYLSLPSATSIADRMRKGDSANEALRLIQMAEKEAWRIRLEMVQGWDEATMGNNWAPLMKAAGQPPEEGRREHPIMGPFLSVLYDERGPRHTASLVKPMAAWIRRERAKAKRQADTSKAPRKNMSANATATQEKKERRRMTQCVQAFVDWATENREPFSADAINRFPKQPGINIERARELLGSFLTALNHSIADDTLLLTLHQHKFPNATQDAVAGCMVLLRESAQKNAVG